MRRNLSLLVILILILVPVSTVLAGPTSPNDSDPTWQASYWNNTSLSGTPALQRAEVDLKHSWGTGSPDASVQADGFSARWTKYIYTAAGSHRFTVTSDDGVRVWVDNELIISEWRDHPATTFTVDKSLSHGHHWVVVEFYENQGNAVIEFSWSSTTPSSYGWRGEYFANTALSGTPAFVRDDSNVNFDWGTSSPSPGTIGIDDFSVRWTRNVDLPAGRYRFTVMVDDGVRLWVNNHLLIESWREQPLATYSQEIYLTGGQIPIKMEYFERGGLAVAKLSWVRLTSAIDNWRGEYFNNIALSGTPVLTRDDANILFDWGTGSPAPGSVPADDFSVRWTRSLSLSGGRYRFMMTVDDGGRLWVNGQLLIDAWRDQAARTYTAEVELSGGAIPIKMEYYEHGGESVARLSWERVTAGTSPGSTPGTVVVDDTDPGFSKGGSYTGWRTVYEGYGGRLLWTWNNDWQRPYYNWGRWQPTLAAGRYEVFVFIPYRYTTTSNAVYLVSHSGGQTSRGVNQDAQGDQWVSLGTYWFAGTSSDYVMLTDATGETRLTRLVAFDAVKWVPR